MTDCAHHYMIEPAGTNTVFGQYLGICKFCGAEKLHEPFVREEADISGYNKRPLNMKGAEQREKYIKKQQALADLGRKTDYVYPK